ncbi:DUF2062 domain-containing protein [Hymenobacter psychrotolerans]|uniref:DUF2062 domain-containing protein n=1 Tax=Hymenobacter psychrotolerans DSM 18569 TaxID=1121959 RepID=A0A1M6UGQ4_9BACT|nr:DUF2062 domain-containing protein [Hymenobacter psychrotolerans]SHK68351.1 hypothetical protein SAMN02746009_01355 [Hymenobacter psychrotolerans DSM 18569]
MSVSVPPVSPPPVPASWWRRRIAGPLLNLLKQGLSPAQLSLTVALGVIFGTVPILGITTLMATATAMRLRLNVAALLLISHLMSPLQLLLVIPLLKLGARLLDDQKGPALTLPKLQYLFANDWGQALRLLWLAGLGALLIWAVVSVPVGVALNFGLRPVFRRLLARQAGKETPAEAAE